jgi:hypothetical protein
VSGKSQARPSARSVAKALTHAGRPVHFTTVARWKRQGSLTIAGSSHALPGPQAASGCFSLGSTCHSRFFLPRNGCKMGLSHGLGEFLGINAHLGRASKALRSAANRSRSRFASWRCFSVMRFLCAILA